MDDIQKTLIKAGRRDLAQEYYQKVAGRSRTVNLLFKPYYVFDRGRGIDPLGGTEWKKAHGKPSPQSIKKYVAKFNEQLEPPKGVNQHLGMAYAIYGGEIVRQSTGDVLAEWEDKSIIRDYKNRPKFQVI